MAANVGLMVSAPAIVLVGVAALLVAKIAICFALGRLNGQDTRNALRFAIALPQGSEFSFVLFGAAVAAGALGQAQADTATFVIALSMVMTPILFAASEKWLIPRIGRKPKPVYDTIAGEDAPVIIAGFGRVGQVVGRLLRLEGIRFTALDQDPEQIDVVRRFGNKVYYGNPARADLLRAAGAETAKLVVVALEDMEDTLEVVDTIRRNFPKLTMLVRARNRRHAHLLMDRGVKYIVRETLYSSLRLSELVLEKLDVPAAEAHRAAELFLEDDEKRLAESHDFYNDEAKLIQSTRDAARELAEVFEADRMSRVTPSERLARRPAVEAGRN
jgi:voltage-gated potassium channel Kch